jgi:precorrin-6A/cobalt-precorrin-6A reductase
MMGSKANVVVMAGTADGRQIVSELAKLNIKVVATVTSSFGSELLEGCSGVDVRVGKLGAEEIASLIKRTGVSCLVDASHPYAREASINAIEACRKAKVAYLRFERREANFQYKGIIRVRSFDEAAEKLKKFAGNILLTIGSSNLKPFTQKVSDYRQRLFARVLSQSSVLAKCEEAGLTAHNIIAVKGPFTVEMNVEMLKYCEAKVVVTKDSGEPGGTSEKLEAAKLLGIPVILVERPRIDYGEVASSVEAVVDFVISHV